MPLMQLQYSLMCSFILVFCCACSIAATAAELTALEVMQGVDDRYDGDSAIAEYTMVLIDRRDRRRPAQTLPGSRNRET